MNKEELKITQQDKLLLQEMRENCLKADVYDDEKRLLKANAITKFLHLPQENKELKEIIDEVREYMEKNTEFEHDGDEYGYTEWVNIKPQNIVFINELLQILDKVKGE